MNFPWLFLLPFIPSYFFMVVTLVRRFRRWGDQHRYMLTYKCFKASEDRRLNTQTCARIILRSRNLGLEEYRFSIQTIASSGIGKYTYEPKNVLKGNEEHPSLADAVSEMEEIIFSTLDQVFKSPDLDQVISMSSLTARIINKYKMREDIRVYNLAGMGCSASLITIDLVQHLFKLHALAVVASTESLVNTS